jgi:hypothetical protein
MNSEEHSKKINAIEISFFVRQRQANFIDILSDLEPLRESSNKKTLYSTRSCVNLAFFGTRGRLKRSFHSRFKLAHSCQKPQFTQELVK